MFRIPLRHPIVRFCPPQLACFLPFLIKYQSLAPSEQVFAIHVRKSMCLRSLPLLPLLLTPPNVYGRMTTSNDDATSLQLVTVVVVIVVVAVYHVLDSAPECGQHIRDCVLKKIVFVVFQSLYICMPHSTSLQARHTFRGIL